MKFFPKYYSDDIQETCLNVIHEVGSFQESPYSLSEKLHEVHFLNLLTY